MKWNTTIIKFMNFIRVPIPPVKVGEIYEDCSYHPVLCTEVDNEGRTVSGDYNWGLAGISLFDGSGPRACSYSHCGVRKLTFKQVAYKLKNRGRWFAAFEEFSKSLRSGEGHDDCFRVLLEEEYNEEMANAQ